MAVRQTSFNRIIMLIVPVLFFIVGCASLSGTKNVGDITMKYRILGKGYPLVMITGFSGTMDLWAPDVLDALSSHYKVIIFDNRGMGGTAAGSREFTIEQFADDAAGIMDALGIDRAHVLGWSMGTEIAQELALRHPAKVDKLILYAADCSMQAFPPAPDVLKKMTDTSGTPEEQGRGMLSLLFPENWLKEHGEYVAELFSRPMEHSLPENIDRQNAAMENWKGSCDRLDRIEAPTLLITGTDDILTPPENSYMMVGKIPGAQLVTIANGGHGVMFQYPRKFSESIITFLEE